MWHFVGQLDAASMLNNQTRAIHRRRDSVTHAILIGPKRQILPTKILGCGFVGPQIYIVSCFVYVTANGSKLPTHAPRFLISLFFFFFFYICSFEQNSVSTIVDSSWLFTVEYRYMSMKLCALLIRIRYWN